MDVIIIIKTSGDNHFRKIKVDESFAGVRLTGSLDEFFAKSSRGSDISPKGHCED